MQRPASPCRGQTNVVLLQRRRKRACSFQLESSSGSARTQMGKPQLTEHLGKVGARETTSCPLPSPPPPHSLQHTASLYQWDEQSRIIITVQGVSGPGVAACVFTQQNFQSTTSRSNGDPAEWQAPSKYQQALG